MLAQWLTASGELLGAWLTVSKRFPVPSAEIPFTRGGPINPGLFDKSPAAIPVSGRMIVDR